MVNPEIVLCFYKGQGDWFDKAIRVWQSIPRKTKGSKYSHVEVLIGSRTISADANIGKVTSTVYKYYNPDCWDMVHLPVSRKQLKAAERFAEEQVGKPYDYVSIFLSQMLAIKYDTPSSWFCSELSAAISREAGFQLPPYNSWYNPRRLYEALR